MLYLRPSFTCPASNNTSQKKWDLAFLTKSQFIKKYKISESEYAELATAKLQ